MAVQKTIPINNNNNNTNNTSAAGVRTIRLPLHEGTTDPFLFQHQQQQQWAQQHYVQLRPRDLLRVFESTYEVSVYTAGTNTTPKKLPWFCVGILWDPIEIGTTSNDYGIKYNYNYKWHNNNNNNIIINNK
ncbi:hypothetical protein IV203_020158 [Nitzschia inconspicua]|uniref:Uncharacterized protein n=1 Tax=Nitzschia inconspicua TaxID=303405 RepID=A0A9K3K9R4_9STRA|nr:hypothetical protein IV203_020348 [Nitzschia inconspicua]KAG7371588.1 hypothetical protein IV203_020158 [Nitzschia inconspicua]